MYDFNIQLLHSHFSWLSFKCMCHVLLPLHEACLVCDVSFCVYWRMAAMNLLKQLKGNTGSGSSRRKSFRAPVITWISSHCPSSRSSCSSAGTTGIQRRRKRMKKFQFVETNHLLQLLSCPKICHVYQDIICLWWHFRGHFILQVHNFLNNF